MIGQIYVGDISILSLILRLDFGSVVTMWLFFSHVKMYINTRTTKHIITILEHLKEIRRGKFEKARNRFTTNWFSWYMIRQKWVGDCCLTPIQHFFTYIMARQVSFQWDDNEVRFVLDQQAELDFYSASSPKQQSTGRNVAPLWHIILIPSQPVFALSS